MNVHEVLVAARNLIDKGWGQDQAVRPRLFRSTRYCVVGALDTVSGGFGAVYERGNPARDAYWGPLWTAMGDCPMGFNDAKGRTKAEVLAAFDAAIAATAPAPQDPFAGTDHPRISVAGGGGAVAHRQEAVA